jgi:hypothetical protein
MTEAQQIADLQRKVTALTGDADSYRMQMAALESKLEDNRGHRIDQEVFNEWQAKLKVANCGGRAHAYKRRTD